MTTEENTIALFNRFIFECLKTGLSLPNYLLTDYVYSQILSVNAVFNIDLSFENYLTKCFRYVKNLELDPPDCCIHTDIRFFIIKVKNLHCIKNIELDSVRNFFIYVIILLSLQTSFLKF